MNKPAASHDARRKHPVKPELVRAGDIMVVVQFVRVDMAARDGESLQVTDLDTTVPLEITGKDLIGRMHSADQVIEEIPISRTEMVNIMMESRNVPFTVVFTRKDGARRRLRGRYVSTDVAWGRTIVDDLDLPSGVRTREVDHRTLESLVIDGVRYVLKR